LEEAKAMRRAAEIALAPEQRQMLEKCVRSPRTPVRLVLRSSVILLAADGVENRDIAKRLRLARGTVGKWRSRFSEDGFSGIEKDATRLGRRKKYSRVKVAEIVRKTTMEKPRGETHCSRTSMASETGVSESTIGRIWHAHKLKPHLFRTFKVSNDPLFAEKLEDIVGLYLHPPEHAVVFSADEKSQIQALDRTQPGLPLNSTLSRSAEGFRAPLTDVGGVDGLLATSVSAFHLANDFLGCHLVPT
jgi:transposase